MSCELYNNLTSVYLEKSVYMQSVKGKSYGKADPYCCCSNRSRLSGVENPEVGITFAEG